MKLERFFEKFEQFADAPDAVAKMRELILESAIRGNLVPRNASDEPVSALLKRMETCAQTGKARKQAVLPPVGDEAYLQIPPGWEWTRLGNTGRIFNGDSVSESGKAELAKIKDGLSFIATKDVGYGRDTLAYDNGLKVTLGDPRFKVAHANAVLICAEGGSAGRKIGVTDRDICFGNKLYANEVWDGTHPRYIFYVYQAPTFFREFAARMTGIIGGISRSEFLSLPIPLPPEEEQKRIVAKVDELMALCDRLEAQQQERDIRHAALARASLARFAEAPTTDNLDFLFHPSYTITPADLRKSILTLAVQGKLVSQDPNDEPSANLVAELARLKAQLLTERKIRNQKVSNCPSEDEHPFEIPESWKWIRLGQAIFLLGGFAYESSAYVPTSSNQIIRLGNVKSDELLLDQKPAFITDTLAEQTAEYAILDGDILVTMTGTKAKRDYAFTLVVKPTDLGKRRLFLNQRLGAIRPFQRELVPLINVFLKSDQLLDLVFKTATGTANQANIGTTSILDLPFPLPPLAEQRRIVAKVDQLMALVDQLESQVAEAKAKSAALLEAVVHELLNPSAEVIDLASYRASIGCYAISKMSDKPYFGRTTAVKSLYFGEAHVGMRLGFQHERKAAGPLDPWIYRFEEEGKQKEWFKAVENTSNGKMKVEYQPGKMLAAQAAQAEMQLTQKQRKEFDRLLDLLSDKKTEEVEIIATLFAAWNDFLIDGHAPTDDEIVTEVRENWHESKERFTPAQLRQWLGWLRQNNLVPQGRLPRTIYQPQLLH